MDAFIRYQRRLFAAIILLTIAGTVAMALIFPGESRYAVGFACGGVIGLIVFRLRAASIANLQQLPPEQWQKSGLKSAIFSYGIMIGAVIAALLIEAIDPYAVFSGMILERVVLIADGILRPHALTEESGTMPAIKEGEGKA
ncbi:MAG: hypothetical protein JXA52_05630 [Planctomycetes bacterium]|nr:hypothetical protein [Planctomycetota bacterium]